MPTYLTPGVYVEEVPSANKPIEGVSTSIAAFVVLGRVGKVNSLM
jgi:phage tail sheath protein FI